ncbi:ribbon-helix-helix protein, CopG family [Jiangella aurantiaca]|uniref:Ribbon-helix-helix protein, CopG family n=1 Tax=Jiangella aurantiaca TaxID=2530373 RepID=A0A4R5A190_9ACTN|nr:ribbon-helix-helix protein, CopG family [Jiangella aurantiaca]TDD64506.1 ribbon-helix-helix protein, CopG family [Jiangella aurantiaca]
MSKIEDKIKEIQDESEATRDDPYPENTVVTRPNLAGSVVQSVRLPAAEYAQVEQLARDADVPVSAMIRGLVLSGLAARKNATLKDAINRLIADADDLRRFIDHDGAA